MRLPAGKTRPRKPPERTKRGKGIQIPTDAQKRLRTAYTGLKAYVHIDILLLVCYNAGVNYNKGSRLMFTHPRRARAAPQPPVKKGLVCLALQASFFMPCLLLKVIAFYEMLYYNAK